jgi:hypothetical protein
MSRDELYTLVWSKPVTEVGLLVGMSGNGLAKACRRHGVQVPPRGYWQRLEAGQVIERALPPENGHLETGVRLKGSLRPVKDDPTGAMLRRRAARVPTAAASEERPPAMDDAAAECARILDQGLRQQLRDAAARYLAGVADEIPTLDEATRRATASWIDMARSTLTSTGPAEEAAAALRARSAGRGGTQAWLSALVLACADAEPTQGQRRRRHAVGSGPRQ